MISMLLWFAGVFLIALGTYLLAIRGIPRERVITIERDLEWERENDLYNRYDRLGKPRPKETVSPYDTCGCIAPCPDHISPTQDAARDRAYWTDRYAEKVPEVDQEQD